MSGESKEPTTRQQHWRTEEMEVEKEGSSSTLHPHLLRVSTTESRSSNAFSLSTKRKIQNITTTFAPCQNFFAEHSHNHHHSLRPFHTPTMRRCRVLWIVSKSCEVMRRAVATCRLFFLLKRVALLTNLYRAPSHYHIHSIERTQSAPLCSFNC